MEKGQVFSLDLLIAMIAVTAAIGLMIQAVEVNTYMQKEETIHHEMKRVAETAADLILFSSDTTCMEGTNNLANCIDTGQSGKWEEKMPAGFECQISVGGTSTDCGQGYSGEDFYEVKRSVIAGSRSGANSTLIVRVWKA